MCRIEYIGRDEELRSSVTVRSSPSWQAMNEGTGVDPHGCCPAVQGRAPWRLMLEACSSTGEHGGFSHQVESCPLHPNVQRIPRYDTRTLVHGALSETPEL
jgi:hypothetical protein